MNRVWVEYNGLVYYNIGNQNLNFYKKIKYWYLIFDHLTNKIIFKNKIVVRKKHSGQF